MADRRKWSRLPTAGGPGVQWGDVGDCIVADGIFSGLRTGLADLRERGEAESAGEDGLVAQDAV